MASIIYLVEADQKIAQAIVNPAIKNGFEIFIFSKFSNLLNDLRESRPEAIFLRSDLLPQSPDELRLLGSFYTLVYGKLFDPDTRISYYNLGVRRVVDGAYFKPATLSLLLKQYLYSQNELPVIYLNKMTRQSLRDLSVQNLLQNCLLEKKNLSAKIIDNNWSAKLRLRRGLIEAASSPAGEGTIAVLDMLQHKRGEIFLNYYSNIIPPLPFEASTRVHLLEFQHQQTLWNDFLQKCGDKNPIFKKGKLEAKSAFTPEEKSILKLLDQRLSLKKLLKLSSLSSLKNLRIIEKLFEQGFIEIEREDQGSLHFSEEDFEYLYEKLFHPGQRIGQILILGSSEAAKHLAIDTIAKSTDSQVVVNNMVEITAVTLEQQVKLYFVALPLDDQIHHRLETFVSDLVATVFIVDQAGQAEMDYQKYFLRQFLTEYSLPFVIGVANIGENAAEGIEQVKHRLEVPSHIPVSAVDLKDFPQLRQVFLKLLDSEKT